MQEAGFIAVLRTILTIVTIYYVFKFIMRFVGPFLMRFMVTKAENKFKQQYQSQQRESSAKEGEVTIDKMPNKKSSNNNTVGEYVDYEEVK